jgi:hypothetical protein
VSERRVWAITVLLFGLLFVTTAHWWGTMSVDTRTADLAAWRLAHTGSLDVAAAPDLPVSPFLVHVHDQLVPDRTMGVVLLGVPLQLLLSPLHPSRDFPGTLTAALCTAVTLANILVTLLAFGADRRRAAGATVALGLGTATWTVASTELWSHTASLLWLSALLLALSRERIAWAAASTVPLVWSRPHLALIPLAIGLALLAERRSLRPIVTFGAAGIAAFGGLLVWNDWIYGRPSLTGAYYGDYVGTRLTSTGTAAANSWLENVLGTGFSPLRGVFLYSPVVAFALVCAYLGWRHSPAWARGALVGGAAYLAVQLKLNGFSGGAAFFGNRLVLESLLLGTPTAYVGYLRLAPRRPQVVPLARLLAGISIAVHATGALLSGAAPNYLDPAHPWRTWLLLDDLRATWPLGGWVLAVAVAGCLAATIPRRAPDRLAL